MTRFIPYILKTLLRHKTRTLLTLSGSAVAFFVFCFVGAVGEGMDGLRRDSQADRTLIVFQANRFCPFTSQLPLDYERTIAKLPGVADVVPIKVFTNNCRASLDVVVFHGLPADKIRTTRELTLTAGDWSEFNKRSDGAMVGRGVAKRRGLQPGDRFTIGGVSVHVAGVFAAHPTSEEDFVYTQLDFLQRARGQNQVGYVTQFEVRLRDGADAAATAAAIDSEFRAGSVATDTRTKGVFQADTLGDLAELIHFARFLGYACVALVMSLVATTTVMAVQDRMREHAVLQTLGFSAPRIFALIVTESFLLSLLGGAIGISLAMAVLAWRGLTVGAEGVAISIAPSLSVALTALSVSFVVGIVAGLVPGWQAARSEIVAALRQA